MKLNISDEASHIPSTSSTQITMKKYRDQSENCYELVDFFSRGTDTLNNEISCLITESTDKSELIEAAEKVLQTTKASIEEANDVQEAIIVNLKLMQQELLCLKQKSEDQQATSYDGIFIWKIRNVKEKLSMKF